jgi:hypothetical protein
MTALARATIFRHVTALDISYEPRSIHWIDNFERHIMAFSCELDLELFYHLIQRHSELEIVFPDFCSQSISWLGERRFPIEYRRSHTCGNGSVLPDHSHFCEIF